MAFYHSPSITSYVPQLWLSFMPTIFKCYLRLFLHFKAIHLSASQKFLLVIWQLKSSAQNGQHFFSLKLNLSSVIPFLVKAIIIHPVFQVILYSFQTFPCHQPSMMNKYSRLHQLINSRLSSFLHFHCFYLSQAFIILWLIRICL